MWIIYVLLGPNKVKQLRKASDNIVGNHKGAWLCLLMRRSVFSGLQSIKCVKEARIATAPGWTAEHKLIKYKLNEIKITCSILAWRAELDYIQFTAWHAAVQMEYVHAYALKASKPKSKIRWNYTETSQNKGMDLQFTEKGIKMRDKGTKQNR